MKRGKSKFNAADNGARKAGDFDEPGIQRAAKAEVKEVTDRLKTPPTELPARAKLPEEAPFPANGIPEEAPFPANEIPAEKEEFPAEEAMNRRAAEANPAERKDMITTSQRFP